jgi:hypothetical protein
MEADSQFRRWRSERIPLQAKADVRNTAKTKIILLITCIGLFGVQAKTTDANTASKIPVLVELFTSEGCSSCPPADRLLQSLDEKQPFSGAELILLSEHVDYWKSNGWVDPYSSHVFSERQRWYADRFGLESVYTPQVVIDGVRETVGSDGVAIRNAVEAEIRSTKIALTLSNAARDDNRIKLHLTSGDLKSNSGAATVYIAVAHNKIQSHVDAGENGGRTLTHVAVVRVLSAVGTVKHGVPFSKDLEVRMPSPLPANGVRIVAFLQDNKSHKVLGVAEEKM